LKHTPEEFTHVPNVTIREGKKVDIALIAVLGAAMGGTVASYLGVVLDRGWAGSVEGRSCCDGCGRTLRWFELIPVVSFLALRGRCRSCRAVLPRVHLLRETLGTVLGAGAGVALAVALTR
jgi:leader peptidase (prepilin peptidase) / N-methyltransferase